MVRAPSKRGHILYVLTNYRAIFYAMVNRRGLIRDSSLNLVELTRYY